MRLLLLPALQAQLGRDLGPSARRWGPRPIDLDNIIYEGQTVTEGETQVETLFTFCDNCGASFLHPSSFVPVTTEELKRETNMTCCKRRPPANMVARSRARG